jgi:hypothetical protein
MGFGAVSFGGTGLCLLISFEASVKAPMQLPVLHCPLVLSPVLLEESPNHGPQPYLFHFYLSTALI